MAATWDPDLVQREGQAIGQQVRAFGRNMLLGPTVNIARLPQWGFKGLVVSDWASTHTTVEMEKAGLDADSHRRTNCCRWFETARSRNP